MKKTTPLSMLTLLIYLYLITAQICYHTEGLSLPWLFHIYQVLLVILLLFNIVTPFRIWSRTSPVQYLGSALAFKLWMIPIFSIFLASTLMVFMVPGFVLVTPLIFALACVLLWISGLYAAVGTVKAVQLQQLSMTALIVNVLLQVCFCLDVFSAFYVWHKLRKAERQSTL